MSHHALQESEKVLETMPAQLAQPVPPVASSGDSTVAPTFIEAEKHDSKTSSGDDVEKTADATQPQQDTSGLLTGKKLALVFSGMLLSVFLIALDQTILAPALPVIASKFNSLEQIAWIASAYFLTQTALLPLYGQALTVFDRKWCYLFAIFLFEVGSLVCAVATSVDILIFGRALAGCGAAGIFVAVLSIIADVTTLEQRPALLGLFGGIFAISSVVGPLLGGVFTDHVSWRWCFYINLPIGAITIAVVTFVLGPQPAGKMSESVESFTRAKVARWTRGKWNPTVDSYFFRLASLDWVGSVIMLGLITCLVLALQWGGIQYAWSSGPVVGTLVGFAVLVILFVLYEWKLAGPAQLLPFRYFKDRSQVGASLYVFCVMLLFLVFLYYLPIYYEAIRGVSASKAGINILPFMISSTFAAGAAGGIVSKTGRYWYIIVVAPCLSAIGAGLLFTVTENTGNGKLIGFQILYGIGLGMILQQPIIVVQATAPTPEDIPQKTAIVTFSQLIGGTVGIAIANSVFFDKLAAALTKYAPDADVIVRTSVESIKHQPEAIQPAIKHAYAEALKWVFIFGVPCAAAASIIAILLIKNVSIKGNAAVGGGGGH